MDLGGTRDRWNILLAPGSHKCNIMIADFIREQALLWIQVDSLGGLLKSTPQPPCSACRVDVVGIQSVLQTRRGCSQWSSPMEPEIFYKLLFDCLHANICDISSFTM